MLVYFDISKTQIEGFIDSEPALFEVECFLGTLSPFSRPAIKKPGFDITQ